MKTKITYKDLKAMHPCYKPEDIGITKDYVATIPEFIKKYRNKVKGKGDIMWALCRKEYMTEKNMRLFAVWCARESLKLIDKPDERSINACNVAEKFANGEATQKELNTARCAAWDAAWGVAGNAARGAARCAAWAAVGDARDTILAVVWAAWGVQDAQIDKLLTYF